MTHYPAVRLLIVSVEVTGPKPSVTSMTTCSKICPVSSDKKKTRQCSNYWVSCEQAYYRIF